MHLSRLPALAAALSVPAFAAPAPSPAGTPHPITCGDPKTIGTVIPTRPTTATPHTETWQVAAAHGVCVIIGWTSSQLVASWDDGATFTPFAAGDKIQSAAVGDAGTVYVLRVGGMLDVFHTDGTVAHRDLTNGALGRLHCEAAGYGSATTSFPTPRRSAMTKARPGETSIGPRATSSILPSSMTAWWSVSPTITR